MSPDARPEQAGSGAPADATASDAVPVVVVRGAATPEEVAALTAVLAAASGDGEDSGSEVAPSAWAAHGATLRRPVGHGPGAWRNSFRS